MKTTALILAAGEGTRMKSPINKHFLTISGKPLILHTLQIFQMHPLIQEIILVGAPGGIEKYQKLVENAGLSKLLDIIPGGKTRQESCMLGVQRVEDTDLVAVHDGARPLVDESVITRTIRAAIEYGGAITAVHVKDTLKEVDSDGWILHTPDRKIIWQAQTPQVFPFNLLREAHQAALSDGFLGTDEASLVERLGYRVKIAEGDYRNIKVTTPEDLLIAKQVMSQRKKITDSNLIDQPNPETHPLFRVGLGHDSHSFVEEGIKPLILGGMLIEGHKGLSGNSDGDVILHAVFNALSQAVGEHSIGFYADPLCIEQGITDSREYLIIAYDMIKRAGYKIANVGISVECRTPRLEEISSMIKESIANILGILSNQVGITATTGEGLTAFGRGEGIQVWVVVSLILENR